MKKNKNEYNIITIDHLRKNSNINKSKNNNRYSIKNIKSPIYNIDSKEYDGIIKANPFSPLNNNISPLKTIKSPSEELYLFKLKNTPSSQNSQILYYDNLYFNKQNFDMNNNYNQILNKRFFSPLNNHQTSHSIKYYSPTFATSPLNTNNNILTLNNNNQNNIIYTNSTNNDNVNYYSITTNDNNNINNISNIHNNNNIYNNSNNIINDNNNIIYNNNNNNIYNNNNINNNIYNKNNIDSMNIMVSEEYPNNNNNEKINDINNNNIFQNNPPYDEKLFNNVATYIQKMYRGYSLRKNMYSSIQYFVNFQNAFISLENLFYYKFVTYSWNLLKYFYYKPKSGDVYDSINTRRPLTISIDNKKNHPIRNSLNKFSFNINNGNDNNIKIKSLININNNKYNNDKNIKISSLNNFSLLNSDSKDNIKKLKEENNKLLKNYYEILIDKDVFIAQVKNLKLILKDITKNYYEIKEEYEKEIKNYKLKCKEIINKENELNKKFTLKNNTKEYEKLDKLYKDLKREYMFLKKDFNNMEDELNDVYNENKNLKKKVNDAENNNNNNEINEIKNNNEELRKKIFKLLNIKSNNNNNEIDILIKNKILKQFFILYAKREEKTLDYNFKRFKNQTINNKKFINDKIKKLLIKNLMKNKINKDKNILSEYFNKLKINNNKIILDPEKPNKYVDPILYRNKQLRDLFYNKINQMKNYVHKKFSQFYYKGLLNQMKYGNLPNNEINNNNIEKDNNNHENNNNNKNIENKDIKEKENNEEDIRNKAKTLKQLLIEKKKAQKSLLKSSFYKFYLKGIIKYIKNSQSQLMINSPIKEEEKINFDDNTSSHTKNLPLSEGVVAHEKINSNLTYDNSETTSFNNNIYYYNNNDNIKQIEKEKLLEFLLYKKERNINMILKNKIIMWNLRAKIFKRDEYINKKKKKKKKNKTDNDKLRSIKPMKFSFNIIDSDEEEESEEDEEDYEIIDIKYEIQKYFALNKCAFYFKNKMLKKCFNKWKKNINNKKMIFNLSLFNHLIKNCINNFENCNDIIQKVVNKKYKKLFLKKLSNN